jgi:hypothetical protein
MFFVTWVFFTLSNQNLHESRLKSAPTRMNQVDAFKDRLPRLFDRRPGGNFRFLDIPSFALLVSASRPASPPPPLPPFGIDCEEATMLRLAVSILAAATAVSAFSPSAFRPASTVRVSPVPTLSSTPSLTSPSLSQPAWTSRTELCAMLQQTELPEKLYFPQEKEVPKVLGGLKIGLRELVVVTGASSGLGLNCAVTLAKTGKYFVVMACRDVEKGKKGALVVG